MSDSIGHFWFETDVSARYLRQFVPQYSTVVAPISDLLKDPRFRTKRAKKGKVPWGEEQNNDFNALIETLTSPPILDLPCGQNRPRCPPMPVR